MSKTKHKYSLKHYNNKKVGNRTLYELSPGNWVSRGNLPETKAFKKAWNEKNEINNKIRWQKYYWSDPKRKEKMLEQSRNAKRRRNKITDIDFKYNNSEHGYMMNLFNSCRRSAKKRGMLFKFNNFEEWWGHWLEQKYYHGMKCPYTKVTMTFIRGKNYRKGSGGKRTPTNVSADQIYPGKGYTPHNLLFCTVKANFDKRSITPDMCQAVIDTYNYRCWLFMIRNVDPQVRKGGKLHMEQVRKIILNHDGHFTNYEKRKMWDVFYIRSLMERAEDTGDSELILRSKKLLKDCYKDEIQ